MAILSLIASKCINCLGIIYRNFKNLVELIYYIFTIVSYENYLPTEILPDVNKQKHICNCVLSFKKYVCSYIISTFLLNLLQSKNFD